MTLLPTLLPHSPVGQSYGRQGDPLELEPALCLQQTNMAIGGLIRESPRLAVRVMAGWLSTREAVWWSLLCQTQLRVIPGALINPGCLRDVYSWVLQPNDTNKEAAAGNLQRNDPDSLRFCIDAIRYTTGNLSPSDKFPVSPPSGLSNRMAALSVTTAADEWKRETGNDCLGHFLEIALDVSECKCHWGDPQKESHPGLRYTPPVKVLRRRLGNIWEGW